MFNDDIQGTAATVLAGIININLQYISYFNIIFLSEYVNCLDKK